jgi:hypothetical protein
MAQWDDRHPGWLLRISERSMNKGLGRRLIVKCGDCDNKVEIYELMDCIEINGVCASLHEWERVLGPMLRQK